MGSSGSLDWDPDDPISGAEDKQRHEGSSGGRSQMDSSGTRGLYGGRAPGDQPVPARSKPRSQRASNNSAERDSFISEGTEA